jgi:transposase
VLRVYDLQSACVRLDSTMPSGHWTVTEDGLFQFGDRKDHRLDLPQVKGMLSALDPLGLPVATDVVPGQRANDPLYIPAIMRVRLAKAQAAVAALNERGRGRPRFSERPAAPAAVEAILTRYRV